MGADAACRTIPVEEVHVKMLTKIIYRGPSLLEQVVGPLAFAIAYSAGFGIVASSLVFIVVIFAIQAWRKPYGPGRWTE